MSLQSTPKDRAHNFRIVGTIGNEVADLEWQALDSKLLAAAAYSASRRMLYLRFRSGELYRYFTFPPEQFHQFLEADSQGRYFLGQIRDCFPYQRLPRG